MAQWVKMRAPIPKTHFPALTVGGANGFAYSKSVHKPPHLAPTFIFTAVLKIYSDEKFFTRIVKQQL